MSIIDFSDLTVENNNDKLCIANIINLDALGVENATGSWSSPTGAIIEPSTAVSTTASNLIKGENLFIWTIEDVCGQIAMDTRFNWNKAELIDNTDTTIPFGTPSSNAFNVGIGLYYANEKFYAGASIPSLMRNAITSDAYSGLGTYGQLRPNYLMGGLIFPINNTLKIRPSLLVSYIKNAPLDVDFNLSVLFMDKFWIGASYRLEESIDAFVQFPLTKQIRLAIGVDYATTELNQFTKGSGEIMIEYLFQQDGEKVNNIRFF